MIKILFDSLKVTFTQFSIKLKDILKYLIKLEKINYLI